MAASSELTLIGSLFGNLDNEPINQGKIHLYTGDNKFLAVFDTDTTGHFQVEVKSDLSPNLIFRLCQETPLLDESLLSQAFSFLRERNEVAEVTYAVTAPIKNGIMDVGNLTLNAPYEKEQVPISYLLDLGVSVAQTYLTGGLETLKQKLLDPNYTTADLQAAFKFGSVPLTPENTFLMLTNGICPIYFKRSAEGLLLAEVNWDNYNFDKLESLPNVKVFFDDSAWRAKQQDLPRLVRIELQYRRTLYPSKDFDPVQIYYPDQPDFLIGLRVANSAFALFGECVFHLGIGHIYAARYAQDVHDYLQGTALGELLLPHCHYVRRITFDDGASVITGEHGVLSASALNTNGITQILLDTEAFINPFTYKPRKVMWRGHYFAKIQRLSYKIIRKTVHQYLAKNRDRIISEWKQVHSFFEARYRNSPFFRPYNGEDTATAGYTDTYEIGGAPRANLPPRSKYQETDPEVKAMPWIARDPNGPTEFDWWWMELHMSHFVHDVSAYHSQIHPTQYFEDGSAPPLTDLNFSPITTNSKGVGLNGGISLEEAWLQESVLHEFTVFPVLKFALINAEGVNPDLIRRFKQATAKFLSYRFSVDRIQVSTVI